MKKLFLIAALLVSCTETNQHRAEKLVKSYLNDHLNDPHSYESVSFGPITKHFEIRHSGDSIMNGWQIINNYRAKNGFGALTLHSTTFQIDSAMTRVLYGDEN